jgi:hypothetical protein
MFKSGFVVAVKVNGRVLSEQGNIVKLPFGSEYTILLKNLENRSAVADVTVDGRKVVDQIIVPKNDSVEIERFVDSMVNGYKLKFIGKAESVERYRGNKVDDGILRVTYRFEKEKTLGHFWEYTSYPIHGKIFDYESYPNPRRKTSGDIRDIHHYDTGTSPSFLKSSHNNCFCSTNDKGITVEGDDSHQGFTFGNVDELEYIYNVITLKMVGFTPNIEEVLKPFYVKQKVICKYCGFRWDNRQKYCGNCGSRLNT